MLKIRDAVIEDFLGIDRLYEQVDKMHRVAHPDIYVIPNAPVRTPERINMLISDETIKLIVAEEKGMIVGVARGEVCSSADVPLYRQRKWILVGLIAVDEEFRGNGIGQVLLNSIYEWGEELNIKEVELTVYEFNDSAARFYEKNGFSVISSKMKKRL